LQQIVALVEFKVEFTAVDGTAGEALIAADGVLRRPDGIVVDKYDVAGVVAVDTDLVDGHVGHSQTRCILGINVHGDGYVIGSGIVGHTGSRTGLFLDYVIVCTNLGER
jgi:hypothetical protein